MNIGWSRPTDNSLYFGRVGGMPLLTDNMSQIRYRALGKLAFGQLDLSLIGRQLTETLETGGIGAPHMFCYTPRCGQRIQ
jgi:hypothetical protein